MCNGPDTMKPMSCSCNNLRQEHSVGRPSFWGDQQQSLCHHLHLASKVTGPSFFQPEWKSSRGISFEVCLQVASVTAAEWLLHQIQPARELRQTTTLVSSEAEKCSLTRCLLRWVLLSLNMCLRKISIKYKINIILESKDVAHYFKRAYLEHLIP